MRNFPQDTQYCDKTILARFISCYRRISTGIYLQFYKTVLTALKEVKFMCRPCGVAFSRHTIILHVHVGSNLGALRYHFVCVCLFLIIYYFSYYCCIEFLRPRFAVLQPNHIICLNGVQAKVIEA